MGWDSASVEDAAPEPFGAFGQLGQLTAIRRTGGLLCSGLLSGFEGPSACAPGSLTEQDADTG